MSVQCNNNIPMLMIGFHEIMDVMAEQLGAYIKLQLLTMIATGNSDWPALSRYTIALKGHDQIYVDTGELRKAITYVVENRGVTAREIKIGVFDSENAAKMYAMEYGTEIAPARPLLRTIHAQEEDRVVDIVTQAVTMAVSRVIT
jgi:hypothetical protein